MYIVIGMLLAFWSGFLVAKYANKPVPIVQSFKETIRAIAEKKEEKKLTPEEFDEKQKVNTFYE